ITTVVANHGEPDHSGALAEIVRLAPKATILCSRRAAEDLPGQYHEDWPMQVVRTGDTLDTGTMTMTFIMAPMCHWPDNMMAHLAGPDVLFSNDVFGQHFTHTRFDDEADAAQLWFEAEKYFVSIISPYGRNVANRLEELESLDLPIRTIAPSHGAVWRKDIAGILAAYRRWAAQETDSRVVILYDTMYDSTRLMAETLRDSLAECDVPTGLYHLATSDRSDVLTHAYGARGLLIGSSVWHMNVLPSVATLLEDLKTLRFKDRLVGAFGSYGWQKNLSVEIIERRAREANLDVPLPGVACQWRPRDEDLAACRDFAAHFAAAIKEA
ncbi:MAG: anaerobic nitric oxide reductase flavorubredoxin, partial [Planctomycetes bacterium]|nr:anaerobic nitric oxide reductase flavorubredoxin [Planctomycetota bacterium]